MWNNGDSISVECPLCSVAAMARQIFAQADRKGERKNLGWQAYCGPCGCAFPIEVKAGDAERPLGYAVAKV